MWRRAAEAAALRHLLGLGLTLLERNYRCRSGEIDLIMREHTTLLFIEVRYRKGLEYSSPAESVDARKRRRIITTARHYLRTRTGERDPPCRFDVVALWGEKAENIEWIRDAFQSAW
ncbi:MAG: YraN family protein [Candidatus Sedimenticola endophacoides]